MKRIYFLLLTVLISGCIDFRSEYPEIDYYKLTQAPYSIKDIQELDGTLQIRPFSVSSEYNTSLLLAKWNDTRVERYYYHRWITSPAEMVTDFFVQRFSEIKAFKGGILKPTTLMIPDYVLEGQVLEMAAVNSEGNKQGDNYVTISIKVLLIERDPMSTDKSILLSKVYTHKIDRRNNEAVSIPGAFSKAFSFAADGMMADIQKAVKESRK
ncbi:MAG: ABC-type transport auxiliary lipoprotein family protein [Bacteroidota bacterium]